MPISSSISASSRAVIIAQVLHQWGNRITKGKPNLGISIFPVAGHKPGLRAPRSPEAGEGPIRERRGNELSGCHAVQPMRGKDTDTGHLTDTVAYIFPRCPYMPLPLPLHPHCHLYRDRCQRYPWYSEPHENNDLRGWHRCPLGVRGACPSFHHRQVQIAVAPPNSVSLAVLVLHPPQPFQDRRDFHLSCLGHLCR